MMTLWKAAGFGVLSVNGCLQQAGVCGTDWTVWHAPVLEAFRCIDKSNLETALQPFSTFAEAWTVCLKVHPEVALCNWQHTEIQL